MLQWDGKRTAAAPRSASNYHVSPHDYHLMEPVSNRDVEKEKHHISGLLSLANFIACDPGRTTFIHERFDRLAARDMLYLQSEFA
jgi:hypothetical protein